MPINLSTPWVMTLNVLGWPAIHLSVAAVLLRFPADWFDPHAGLFRPRHWERGGRIYQVLFAVRKWKHLLPDGMSFLRGFSKQTLASPDAAYLREFARETCRGELAHWIMLAFTPVFFVWNPPWADAVMCAYALGSNLPCVIVQRYNRCRLLRATSRPGSTAALD